MNPILKNVLAVIAGVVIGGLANAAIINLSGTMFPVEGLDPNDPESIKASMANMPLVNFFMVWLAHALHAFLAGFIITKFAANSHKTWALVGGAIVLLGGLMMAMQIGGPTWFLAADLLLAYIPMAYLGWMLAGKGN